MNPKEHQKKYNLSVNNQIIVFNLNEQTFILRNHKEPFQSPKNHKEPFQSLRNHKEPFQSLRNLKEL